MLDQSPASFSLLQGVFPNCLACSHYYLIQVLLPMSSILRVKVITSELTKEYRRKTNEVIYFLYNVDTSDSMFSATVHCSHIPTAIAILLLCMFRFSI